MLIHKNIQIGKILKQYNGLRTHVDDNGLFIVAELRDDLESARNVWEMIEDGDINSFSIAGEIILSHDECDETKCVRIIDKMNIYEVSVCDIPVNKKSGFMVVSKEENAFENVLCKSLNKGVELMSKEKDCECNETIEKAEVDKPEEIKKSEDTKKSEPETETEEKSEDIEKQEEEEEMPEEEEKTSEQIVESIERRLETLEGMVQELAKKPSEYPYPEKEEKQEEEEEEEDMEEEEEKAKKPEEEQLLDDAIGMIAEVLDISPSKVKDALGGLTNKKEDKEEYPYPMPAEKELDEIKNSIQELAKSLKSEDESKEIETLIKSKEDEIAALNERIETLEKAEVPPKTTTEVEEEREDVVIDKPKSKFAKDSLGTGVWYKDPDL
jgi:HK97 family phage prohead protease